MTHERIIHFVSDFGLQPFLTDAVVAQGTFFAGLAASGLLSLLGKIEA